MKLPPYGRYYQVKRACAWVAIGLRAWEFAKRKAFPVMVLPPNEDAAQYRWPVIDMDVVLIQTGEPDDYYLDRIAQVLLESGALKILAISQALLCGNGQSASRWYYRGSDNAVA